MKILLALAVSFFSWTSFADKNTCSHTLRMAAYLRFAGGSLFLPSPFFLAGMSIMVDGHLLKREANRLKAAHILRFPKNYPEQEIIKSKKIIQKLYDLIVYTYPGTRLLIEDVVATLDQVYDYSVPVFCQFILDSEAYEPILEYVFKDGQLKLFEEFKGLHNARIKKEVDATRFRAVGNAKSSLFN